MLGCILGVIALDDFTDMFCSTVELGMHLVNQVCHGTPGSNRILLNVETCKTKVFTTHLTQFFDNCLAASMRDKTVMITQTFGRRHTDDAHALNGVLDLAMGNLVCLRYQAIQLLLVIATFQVNLGAVLVEAERQLVGHILYLAALSGSEGDDFIGARMPTRWAIEVGRSGRHRKELQGHLSLTRAFICVCRISMHKVMQVVHVSHLVEAMPVGHLPAIVQHSVLAIGNQLHRHPIARRIALLPMFNSYLTTFLLQGVDVHLVDVADIAIHQF